MMDVLLHQEGGSDLEIRALSLGTLGDDDVLSVASLVWMQVGWFWALSATGWLWLLGLVAADLALFTLRWRIRGARTSPGRRSRRLPDDLFVPLNIALIALVAAEVFVLLQVPSDRASVFALILVIGFSGYVVAVLAAFPVLATLNLLMLTVAGCAGLMLGPSELLHPFALLLPFATAAFCLLLQRSHLVLLTSIRSQRIHRLLSLHDPLTKLPNRAFMRDALTSHLSLLGTAEGSASVAVLCLDLDGFKLINDRLGHAAGDWVLVHVAEILRRHIEPGEEACRIGGDEYVLILPGADEKRVRELGRNLIAAISTPFDIGQLAPARVGVSIGAAIARPPAKAMAALLEEADGALYAAKRTGRGRLHFEVTAVRAA